METEELSAEKIISLLKDALTQNEELERFERTALQKMLPWLVDMALNIYHERLPVYEQGAPTRVFRKLEEEGLINSRTKVFRFFAEMSKSNSATGHGALCIHIIYAFLYTVWFEKNWHESFAARFSEEGERMQGLFMLAQLVR